MPKFLEEKLKKEYPDNPHAVFGTMNKLGVMKGNKETAKGKSEEKKHVEDKRISVAKRMLIDHKYHLLRSGKSRQQQHEESMSGNYK